jgi:homoserine/homoserine lactone efflux protein
MTYFAAMWVIALSPGSGAVLSMSHGLSHGVRRTTPTILGLQLGLAVIFLVAGLGVGALLLASAQAFWVVKLLGAAYLMWLGWRQWRAPVTAPEATAETTPEAEQPSTHPPSVTGQPAAVSTATQAARLPAEPALSVRQRVLRGFLTNVTNPKGIVFMAAVLPQFINPAKPLALQLTVLLTTTLAVDVTVMHGYAWLASRLQNLLRSARAKRNQNRVFGSVLMAMGASLLLVKRAAS